MLVSSNGGTSTGSYVSSGGLVVLNGNIQNCNGYNVVPGNGVVGVEPIQATIWHCLNNYAYSDACFLAERVHAEAPSDETLHILSSAYYRSGHKTKTYVLLSTNLLKSPHYMTPKNRYLLALVCFELEKYAEAETTLLKSIKHEPGNLTSLLDQLERTYGDICAFAIKLYALVCVQTERNSNAFEGFSRCLKLNPFLWNCYEHCCNTMSGTDKILKNKNIQRVFQLPDSTLQSQSSTTSVTPTPASGGVPPSSYLPVLIGSTAASLVLQEPQKPESACAPNEPNFNQNNQNYYAKDLSLNSSSNNNFTSSTTTQSTGVLHPSNRNNIKPSKRNLFTSTPMGSGNQPNTTSFGIIPLLMDSSNASTVNSNTSGGINAAMSPYSPVPSDFEHDGGPPAPSGSEPKPKKPCLRTPWQQHQAQPHGSGTPSQMQGTVTISTSSNATVRRSSRLFTHHHSHSHFLKENNKQAQMLSTPPASNVNAIGTPDSGSGGRRSKKPSAPNNSSVLKPKLRLNKSNVGGGSSSSTSTVTGETNVEHKCESTLDSSSEFFRIVMEKSEVEAKEIVKNPEVCSVSNIEAFRNGVDPLLHILSNLSAPYTSQTTYNCVLAIAQYQRLKPSQQETGWVVGNVARCYFELGNYEDSIKYYRRMMELEPWRTDGLEWLSTAYWHLQKETELSALAQDLMKSNRTNEVATWVAAGNCFSLHKEHETAIKFFKRAMQVNSSCAYAYTLLGHEYVLTEELEKAMRCYRAATRIDKNHYNAWYGMGMIFYKQERYERAEVYYRKALAIHPNNSVLLCHLGVVQHALGKPEKSLTTFTRALEANTHDPLCKFHRASVLFGIGKLDEALEELEELKEIVPKESLVYFLIAKIFSKKGDTHKALLHFSWATDLDPKGANNQIKESIEPVLNRTGSTVNVLLHNTANATVEQATNNDEEEEEDDDDDDDDDDDEEEEDDEDEDDEEEEEEETQTQEEPNRIIDNLRVTRSNRRSDETNSNNRRN